MRSLFLFLLLLNILYALWQLQSGELVPDRELDVSALPVPDSLVESSMISSHPASLLGADTSPAALCIRLGVFADREEAAQLLQRLLALDVTAEVVADEIVSSSDYWLVMSVMGGASGALAKLSSLQERGIDSFVITEGPLAGNISLGVFSREDYAAARQAQLQSDGYDVRIERVEKLRSQYSVQVAPEARRLVGSELLLKLREDFPAMQHHYQSCAPVANERNIP